MSTDTDNFQVTPDVTRQLLFNMFYFPLLENGVNYIKGSILDLPEYIEYCATHDDLCAKIATNAQRTADCLLREGVLLGYLYGVMRLIHDKTQLKLASHGA